MNIIDCWRLKALVRERNFETMAVMASDLGGLFVFRPMLCGGGWR